MTPEQIAARNDALRARIPYISKPNVLAITCGVAGLQPDAVADILREVKNIDVFPEGDDPWHEHDFGAFDHDGHKIFWKIDDYGGYDGYELILTVMLAEEY